MIINSVSLDAIRVGFSAEFQKGLGQAPSQWETIATRFPSTTAKNTYGWLGDVPGMRKWIGPRQVNQLAEYNYELANDDFEETIGVSRNDIEDDNLGVYGPRFAAMGRAVGSAKDTLVFALLKAGFATPCYDKQYYFDTDHPVLDENGNVTSVANTDGGAGAPWFLFDSRQPIKPLILQVRKEAQFVSLDRETDANVFMNKQFLYGADGRWAAGFGFWQWCWGSKQALSKANYATARAALLGMKGDYGRPIGVMPDTLVVGPSLEGSALEIVNSERDAAGATNVWKGTAKVIVVPWLA